MLLAAVAPAIPPGTLLERGQSLLGLLVFLVIAYAIGRLRGARGVPWRIVLWGVALQFLFGSIVLFSPGVLLGVQFAIARLLEFSDQGVAMLFGNLGKDAVTVTNPEGAVIGIAQVGFQFALRVLPTIVFVSLLTAVLYHIGLLTLVVSGLAWIMRKTMGTSGAETLSTAANIFVGQTEAPLIVRPFLATATNSELMAIMVGGFANIATGVLAAYSGMLDDFVPEAGGHLALACFISAPATLVVAKLILPETQQTLTSGAADVAVERVDANVLDAATRGTSEGLALALNVGAMLLAFTALVALLNALLVWLTASAGIGPVVGQAANGAVIHAGITIETILGHACAPIVWLIGVPWSDCRHVGSWLGIKTVLNEFVAYLNMSSALNADPKLISPRSALLATYALCGFANLASIGIQIGGISVLAPTRRHDLSRIAAVAMIGGTIATLMGACVVGVLR
jgi:CNT family concentrative nucleoside transporter